jgi:hypothetical protein
VAFIPSSIFKITIGRKIKYMVIEIPVKAFLAEGEEQKIIYISKEV